MTISAIKATPLLINIVKRKYRLIKLTAASVTDYDTLCTKGIMGECCSRHGTCVSD